jgi:hypothetical protein
MKALILSLIALGLSTARGDILSDVYSDMSGPRGTVVCLHGTRGSGMAWKNKPENHAFTQDLLAAGFSFVCPSSQQSSRWSAVNGPSNPDIKNVTMILRTLNARPPFFFIGHANGGGFATRLAAFIESEFKPVAVEFSHASGIKQILREPLYNYPTLYSYSRNDQTVTFSDVRNAMNILRSKGVLVVENDQTSLYPRRADNHAFINTSEVSIGFYNSQIP